MAVTFVAEANTGHDSPVSSQAVNRPGTVQSGDVAVFFLDFWEGQGNFPSVTPPPSAVLHSEVVANTVQKTFVYLTYVGSESSYTFSWSGTFFTTLAAMFFTGVESGQNLSSFPFDSAAGSGTSFPTTSVTTTDGAGVAWHGSNAGSSDSSGTTHTPPTGFNEVNDEFQFASAYLTAAGVGSHSASGATASTSENLLAALLAIEAVATTTSPATVAGAPASMALAVPAPAITGGIMTPATVTAVPASLALAGPVPELLTATMVELNTPNLTLAMPAPLVSSAARVQAAPAPMGMAIPAPTVTGGNIGSPATVQAGAAAMVLTMTAPTVFLEQPGIPVATPTSVTGQTRLGLVDGVTREGTVAEWQLQP